MRAEWVCVSHNLSTNTQRPNLQQTLQLVELAVKIFKVVFVELSETIVVHDLHQHAESLLLGHLRRKSERYRHNIFRWFQMLMISARMCCDKHNQPMVFKCVSLQCLQWWNQSLFVFVRRRVRQTESWVLNHTDSVCVLSSMGSCRYTGSVINIPDSSWASWARPRERHLHYIIEIPKRTLISSLIRAAVAEKQKTASYSALTLIKYGINRFINVLPTASCCSLPIINVGPQKVKDKAQWGRSYLHYY